MFIMFTRRKFLKTVGSAVTLTGAPMLLQNCSAGLATYRGEFDGTAIIVPQSAATVLTAPDGMLLVRAPNLPITIVLRRLDGQNLTALSTVCTHKGCEVRVLPDAYECPCHGSSYHLDGTVEEGPASQPLQSFAVRETTDAIFIQVKT